MRPNERVRFLKERERERVRLKKHERELERVPFLRAERERERVHFVSERSKHWPYSRMH